MTLRPLTVPSLGGPAPRAVQSASPLAQHQQLERIRSALSQQLQDTSSLESRLALIADEPRWNVNVPIGPLAWMPGQLVHTNTIKVRLSEEYVVEYSAKQAVGVAQRRRQMIQDHINRVEKHIKELDPRIRKDLDLPDGWSVNGSNEIVNEEGLPCFEIREDLSDDEHDRQDPKDQQKYYAQILKEENSSDKVRRAALPHQDREALFRALEAEEEEERAKEDQSDDDAEALQSEDSTGKSPANDFTPAQIEEIDDDPQMPSDQPPSVPSATPAPSSPSVSPPKLTTLKSILQSPRIGSDSPPKPPTPGQQASSGTSTPKKAVKWDLEGPQPEAESSNSARMRQPPIPLPAPAASTSTRSSAPMKDTVVERPFNKAVKPSVIERSTNTVPEPQPHEPDDSVDSDEPDPDRLGSTDPQDDPDDDSDGDYDEWDSDGSEAEDFDALMLQRELAMQYHARRYELGGEAGTGPLAGHADAESWKLGHQDVVPEDASLASGQHTATQASRFAGGRMQNARLVIPDLLQQANMQPGDVLDNAPWSSLHGRVYTPEEEARIQARIEKLAMGDYDSGEPEIMQLEDALAETVEPCPGPANRSQKTPKKDPVGDAVVEKPNKPDVPSNTTQTSGKPKRVSRFKAERNAS